MNGSTPDAAVLAFQPRGQRSPAVQAAPTGRPSAKALTRLEIARRCHARLDTLDAEQLQVVEIVIAAIGRGGVA